MFFSLYIVKVPLYEQFKKNKSLFLIILLSKKDFLMLFFHHKLYSILYPMVFLNFLNIIKTISKTKKYVVGVRILTKYI